MNLLRYCFLLLVLSVLLSSDTAGQSHWFASFGGGGNDEAIDVVLSEGNHFVTGYFHNYADFGLTGLNTNGGSDIYLQKIAPTGEVEAVHQYGGSGPDRPKAMAEDNAGNIYITGTFVGTTDIGGQSVIAPTSDPQLFLMKTDSDGNVLWVRFVLGSQEVIPRDIATDDEGNLLLTGHFRGVTAFGSTSFNSTPYGSDQLNPGGASLDLFISKLDGDGNWLWTRQGTNDADATGLALTSLPGSIYLTGQFSDTLTVDQVTENNADNIGFIARFDAAGNETWLKRITAENILCQDIQAYNGSIYLTGNMEGDLYTELPEWTSHPATRDYGYFLLACTPEANLAWVIQEESDSPVGVERLALHPGGRLHLGGQFSCRMDDFAEGIAPDFWKAIAHRDLFLASYGFDGTRWSAHQVGTSGDALCQGVAAGLDAQTPVLFGRTTGVAAVSGIISSYNTSLGAGTCGTSSSACASSPNPHTYSLPEPGFNAVGGSFALPDVPWFDPFQHNGPGCYLTLEEAVIGFPQQDYFNSCNANPDSLWFCNQVQSVAADHPLLWSFDDLEANYAWNTGEDTQFIAQPELGWLEVSVGIANSCHTFTDSVHLEWAEPQCAAITDDFGVNSAACNPAPIQVCDTGSFLLTGAFEPGWQVFWTAGTPPNQTVFSQDSSATVTQSGVYTYVVTDEYDCAYASSIDIAINAPVDSLNPFLLANLDIGPFNSYTGEIFPPLLDGDTVYICENVLAMFTLGDAINPAMAASNTAITWSVTLDGNSIAGTETIGAPGDGAGDQGFNFSMNQGGHYQLTASIASFSHFPCDGPGQDWVRTMEWWVVDEIPDPPVFVTDYDICPGDTAIVEVQGIDLLEPFGTSAETLCVQPWEENGNWYFGACLEGLSQAFFTQIQPHCSYDHWLNVNVAFPPPPSLSAQPESGAICPGDSLVLSSSPAETYTWIGPLGSVVGTEQTLLVETPGIYYVQVLDENGCSTESAFFETYEFSTPFLESNAFPDLCVDGTVTLELQTSGPESLEWLPPLGGNGLTQTVTEPGVYSVQINSCNTPLVIDMEVFYSPADFELTASDSIVCPGESVLLYGPAFEVTYDWIGVDATGWSAEVTEPGTYGLTVTNGGNCQSSGTITLEGFSASPPVALSAQACGEGPALLSAQSDASVFWSSSPTASDTLETGNAFVWEDWNTEMVYVMNSDDYCGLLMDSIQVVQSTFDLLLSDTLVCDSSWVPVLSVGTGVDPMVELATPLPWNPIDSFEHEVFTNASAWVHGLFTDGGCTLTDSAFVERYIPQQPEAISAWACGAAAAQLEGVAAEPVYWSSTPSAEGWLGEGESLTWADWEDQMLYLVNQNTSCGVVLDSIELDVSDFELNALNALVCSPEWIPLAFTSIGSPDTIAWSAPFTVDDSDPLQPLAWVDDSGWAVASVSDGFCQFSDSVYFQLYSTSPPSALDALACGDGPAVLEAAFGEPAFWSETPDPSGWLSDEASWNWEDWTPGPLYVINQDQTCGLVLDSIVLDVHSIALNVTDSIGCEGDWIAISVGLTGTPENLTWATSLPLVVDDPLEALVEMVASGTVTATYQTDGCALQSTANLTLASDLTPELSETDVCLGEDVVFTWNEALDWTATAENASTIGVTSTVLAINDISTTWEVIAVHPFDGCGVLSAQATITPFDIGLLQGDTTVCDANGAFLALDPVSDPDELVIAWSPPELVENPTGMTTAVFEAGTYVVTVSDPNGCIVTASAQVQEFGDSVSLGPDATICSDETYIASLDGTDGFQVVWSNGTVGNTATFSEPGWIGVDVLSPEGCASSDSLQLAVIEIPDLSVVQDGPLCTYGATTLNALPALPNLTWNTGDTGQQLAIDSPGTFSVTWQEGGCSTQAFWNATAHPLPTFNLPDSAQYCFSRSSDPLWVDLGDVHAATWDDGTSSETRTITGPGSYSVTVESAAGCTASGTLEVTEFCPGDVYIPAAFTPDQDGINEWWGPVGKDVTIISTTVWNRWGEVVFEGAGNARWTGEVNGGEHFAPDGIYLYRVEAQHLSSADRQTLTGHVALIR